MERVFTRTASIGLKTRGYVAHHGFVDYNDLLAIEPESAGQAELSPISVHQQSVVLLVIMGGASTRRRNHCSDSNVIYKNFRVKLFSDKLLNRYSRSWGQEYSRIKEHLSPSWGLSTLPTVNNFLYWQESSGHSPSAVRERLTE